MRDETRQPSPEEQAQALWDRMDDEEESDGAESDGAESPDGKPGQVDEGPMGILKGTWTPADRPSASATGASAPRTPSPAPPEPPPAPTQPSPPSAG
jgi:hypothetical protein